MFASHVNYFPIYIYAYDQLRKQSWEKKIKTIPGRNCPHRKENSSGDAAFALNAAGNGICIRKVIHEVAVGRIPRG